MDVRVLGPLEVRAGDGAVLPLGRRKVRTLLGILALSRDQPFSIERVVDLLWPGDAPASARSNAYTYLSDLRRLLGPEHLVQLEGGYRLTAATDSDRYEELVAAGLAAADSGQPGTAVERLTRALGLWRSAQVLEGLDLPDALHPERTRLEQSRVHTRQALLTARLAIGEYDALIPELEALVDEQPLQEPYWELLMLALYQAGRQVDAFAAYDRIRHRLAEELGVDPGERLRHTRQRILTNDPSIAAAAQQQELVPAELPADLPVFTGREAELQQLLQLIPEQPTAVTLVVLNGMPGVGKTALATHFAHQLRQRYPDGQLFLDLHGYTVGVAPLDPADALDRMLHAFGGSGTAPMAGVDGRAALFRSKLADRRVLLLLDNAVSADQVRLLVPAAPGCLVIVTSRSRLGELDEATVVPIDLLPAAQAVELFTRVVGPDRLSAEPRELLDEVAELCGRLPLALRIAAARLRNRPSWSLAYLAERLGDEQTRLAELEVGERTVTGAFRLSYEQLTSDQQRMFRLLGLHPGTDLEPYAAAALTGYPVRQAEQLLEDLLDAHLLLQQTPGRYSFHDLLRAHATALATEHEDQSTRQAALGQLRDHYAATALQAAGQLFPIDAELLPPAPASATPSPLATRADASEWLTAELTNILSTADDSVPDHLVRLCYALSTQLLNRNEVNRALNLYQLGLAAARHTGDQQAEAWILAALGEQLRWTNQKGEAEVQLLAGLRLATELGGGTMAARLHLHLNALYRMSGRRDESRAHLSSGLQIARQTGAVAIETRLTTSLGHWYAAGGDRPNARLEYEKSLQLARRMGDRFAEGIACYGLAVLYSDLEDLPAAQWYAEETVAISREIGSLEHERISLLILGEVDRQSGRYAEALECFLQARRLARLAPGAFPGAGLCRSLGLVYLETGRVAEARAEFEAGVQLALRAGDRNTEFENLHGLGRAEAAAKELDTALARQGEAVAVAVEIGQRHDEARARVALGQVHRDLGEPDRAREQWERALAIFAELDERSAAAVRARLADVGAQVGTTS